MTFISSKSAIGCCKIVKNEKMKNVANQLIEMGFDIKPIMSPSVNDGEGRLRLCLHVNNCKDNMRLLLQILFKFINIKH